MTFVVQQPSIIVVPSGPGQGGVGPPGPPGSGSTVIVENEGVVQGSPVATLNFTGPAVSASVTGTEATIDISSVPSHPVYEVHAFDFLDAGEQAAVLADDFTTYNLTDHLRAASAAITANDGGRLLLPAGAYPVVQQTLGGTLLDGVTPCAWGPEEIITITNCTKPVVISGYGAIVRAVAGYRYGSFNPTTGAVHTPAPGGFYDYDYYGYPYRGMINIKNNVFVRIEGVELDGNSPNAIIGGYFGDSYWQVEGHGIWNDDNDYVLIIDVNSHHQPSDGLCTTMTGITESSPQRPLTIINSQFNYNGRQGHSMTSGKGIFMVNVDMSMTGRAFNTSLGANLASTPGAGMDVEGYVRNLKALNCRAVGTFGAALFGASGYSSNIAFEGCVFEQAVFSRFGYKFKNCTLVGWTNFAVPATNEYLSASSNVTLTIAGTGPYTITRSAGSFVTDGFAAGDTIRLSGGGLNAANKTKDLYVTGISATVFTVKTLDASAMVAEGPIASSSVATATGPRDGFVFEDCHFTYDAELSGTGTLGNTSQSLWTELRYTKFVRCTIDMGTYPLPNMYRLVPASDPSATIIEDLTARSTSATLAAINGRFRGYNNIIYGAAPQFNFGTDSIIESGGVFVNGVLQGASSNVSTQSGTSYTAALTDANTYIRFTNGSAITFTIPPNSTHPFSIGAVIEIEQAGAGALSVAAGSGVTVNSPGADLTLAGIYSVAAVKKVATDTWTLVGDL